jgi:hypothetical protein
MIDRFTSRQCRSISFIVAFTLLMNLTIPGHAAAEQDFPNNTGSFLNSDHVSFDACESECEEGQIVSQDNRDNEKPNSDVFDDFVVSDVVFVSERGAYFISGSTKSYTGRNPVPERRPP